MTLENIVHKSLSESDYVAGRHEWSAADPDSGWSVCLTAERRDQWSTVAWEVALRRDRQQGDLATWAQRIAERVTLEPFKVIEVDAARNEGLLRSVRPTERDGKLYYYELFLKGTASALMRRYQASHEAGDKRQQVAFALANEALAKVIGDVSADK